MASSADKLSGFQRDLLAAFFARERGFYLTGGAALAGFYLAHRLTDDLDLFSLEDASYARGRRVLEDAARSLGASVEVRQHELGFQRYMVRRSDEAVIVDLVRERAPQAYGDEKPILDGIRIDPIDEILANKLTTLLSRAESRDLVDVMLLERAGHRAELALPAALLKDGGCTPATLAWVLSEIEVEEDAVFPGEVSGRELKPFVQDLVTRLRRLAAPR